MPFSIWEYLRERTRDAVLAGFQDALDIAEQGDTEGSQHDAARRLVEKLGGSREAEGEQPVELSAVAPAAPLASLAPHPGASMNGAARASAPREVAPLAAVAPPKAPRRPAEASAFDVELESRLNSAAAPSEPETPAEPRPATTPTGRRRRGRPPKKSEGSR